MVQPSILSFFGSSNKTNQAKASTQRSSRPSSQDERSQTCSLEKADLESPVKKTSRRRALTIESDSEGEEPQPSTSSNDEKEKENKAISPSKSPIKSSSQNKNTQKSVISSPLQPSTSKDPVGFSPTTVPPLRKTARKQIKRKSNSLEEEQKQVVKKIKHSPVAKKQEKKSSRVEKKQEDKSSSDEEMCTTSNEEKVEEKDKSDKKMEIDKSQLKNSKHKGKRNTLDRFFAPKNFQSSIYLSGRDNKSSDKKSSNNCKSSPKRVQHSPTKAETDPNVSLVSSNGSNVSPIKKEKTLELSSHEHSRKISETADNSDVESLDSTKKNSVASPESTTGNSQNKSVEESSTALPSESKKSVDSKINSPKNSGNETNKFGLNDCTSDKDDYNPSKTNYSPIEDASWKRGESVPFAALSKTFEIIEDTSGRLKTIEILSNFLRSVNVLSPEDLLCCIYLCLNKVAPAFEGIELGMGEIYLCRAIAQVTGRSVAMIKSDITEKGDLGIVAELSKSNQRTMFQPARLTVKKVFMNVKEIALMTGQACQAKKIDKIKTMLVACKGSETRFLIRCIGDKLRIGLAEQSILQAIAQACYLTPPNQEYPPHILNNGKGLSAENLKSKIEEHALILKTTYCECPTFDKIIPSILKSGILDLPKNCQLEPGIPLKPMLAHPTKGVSEVLKRFENAKFTCEFKYDGERAQIHLSEDGTVNIFSRNQENNTSKYPDIISRIKNSLGPDVKSCIIDSESVAYDVTEKKILPFQILSTRKRKDAIESEIKVQVCIFPFDLLYLNGKNLVQEPFEVRRELLKKNFIEVEGELLFAKSMDSTNTEDIEEFLEESIKGNCEGLMVKTLNVDATYEIAKRSRNWLKLKKDYLEGVGDTIDVVVIGGYLGKGKRIGTYGGFLLACYDPDNEEFQSLCKIGTGFTEECLQQHATFFKEHIIETPKSYYRYDSTLAPDHWFEAVQVWEIKCADLSISPIHKAALGVVDPEKGISLRFPRFLRIREDKTPENATSASQIAELYQNQDQIKSQSSGKSQDDEEFY